VAQQARNLAWQLQDGVLAATHLLHDRDAKFCDAFDEVLMAGGSEGSPTAFPSSESERLRRAVGRDSA
jgi:hypothetical protein